MGYYERKVDRLFKACAAADKVGIQEALKASKTVFDEKYVAPADINARNALKETPLMVAIGTRNRELVQYVLLQGADVGLKNASGMTALMYAARLGLKDIMSDLLDKQACVNDKTDLGETAVMFAADAAQSQSVIFLIAKQAALNDPSNDGRTVLMRAACSNDRVSLGAILDADAGLVDAIDNYSRTALIHASIKRLPNIVQDLLDRHADTTKRGNDGKTALDLSGWGTTQAVLNAHVGKTTAPVKEDVVAVTAAVIDTPVTLTPRAEKIRAAMEDEGLDPTMSEHWMPIGKSAIEYVVASVDTPKMLSNTFNFASRQYTTLNKNFLTGEKTAEVTDDIDKFPNQDLVAEAYAKLAATGRNPPPWERKVRVREL